MVDNSQGHSAYAADALLILQMNVNPGGKQACFHNGWFFKNGQKIIQPMIFPPDHPDFLNEAKGIKHVLAEHSLLQNRLQGKCKEKCGEEAMACCCKQILKLQPDSQKSLVQEVIEDASHLCIFLPKYHCKLNFIEFFGELSKSISGKTATILLKL